MMKFFQDINKNKISVEFLLELSKKDEIRRIKNVEKYFHKFVKYIDKELIYKAKIGDKSYYVDLGSVNYNAVNKGCNNELLKNKLMEHYSKILGANNVERIVTYADFKITW